VAVALDVLREDVESAADEPHHSIRVLAGASAVDHVHPAIQISLGNSVAVTVVEGRDRVGDRG
jgi:hypothetical protein